VTGDAVVLGAGLAGLTAARHLTWEGQSVTVLEASDQVGGRVRDVVLPDGQMIELGAQWVGPRHRYLRELAAELGPAPGRHRRPAHSQVSDELP
jgi:monoamine oxidase